MAPDLAACSVWKQENRRSVESEKRGKRMRQKPEREESKERRYSKHLKCSITACKEIVWAERKLSTQASMLVRLELSILDMCT